MNKKARSALHALRSARANGALDQTEVQFLDLIEGLVPEHYPNDPKLAAGGPGVPTRGSTVYVGEPNTVYDSSADHWSPWLEWRGGSCPLPLETKVQARYRDAVVGDIGPAYGRSWVARGSDSDIASFRYRTTDHAGWLPRGAFIPPAELWDEGCPVRCEWRTDDGCEGWSAYYPKNWPDITHIRLVAREAKAGLPEWVECDEDGDYIVHFDNGLGCCLAPHYRAEDYDRIAEACTKLAARERARRAGS